MKTYFAHIAEGTSYPFAGEAGCGVNSTMEAEAESRVEPISVDSVEWSKILGHD
jgi:hypothetical protein